METWCLLVEARVPNFSAIQGTNFSILQFHDSFNLMGASFENFELAYPQVLYRSMRKSFFQVQTNQFDV